MQVKILQGNTPTTPAAAILPEGVDRQEVSFDELAISHSDYQTAIPGGVAYFRILDAENGQLEVYASNVYFRRRLTLYVTDKGQSLYLQTKDSLVGGKPSGSTIGRSIRYPVTMLYRFEAVGGDNPKPTSYGRETLDYTPVAEAVGEAYRALVTGEPSAIEAIDHDAWVNQFGDSYARVPDEDIQAQAEERQLARLQRAASRQQRRTLATPAAQTTTQAPEYDPFAEKDDNGF